VVLLETDSKVKLRGLVFTNKFLRLAEWYMMVNLEFLGSPITIHTNTHTHTQSAQADLMRRELMRMSY
jgi:hypothetical protein